MSAQQNTAESTLLAEINGATDGVDEGRFIVPDSIRDEKVWHTYTNTDGDRVPCDGRSVRPQYINGFDPEARSVVNFDEALETVAKSQHQLGTEDALDGVMLSLPSHESLCAIDLDDVVEPDTGEIDEVGADLVNDLNNTFWEISPSGTGLHAYVFDNNGLDEEYKQKDVCEFYSSRALTFTGRSVQSTSAEIAEAPGLISVYQGRLNAKKGESSVNSAQAGDDVKYEPTGSSLSDKQQELVDAMCEYDDDAEELWEQGSSVWTKWQRDRSRADMSLLSRIAWWADESGMLSHLDFTESELIDIFRASDLARREKCQDREDYVRRTIRKAR